MHCLIIVQNYPPEIGPVRYTYDLANSLNESINKISVITGIPNYPTGQKYPGFEKNKVTVKIENGIEVIRIPILRASNTQPVKRVMGFITFIISALPHLIKKRKVDFIIVSIPPFTVLFLGILGKFLFKIPFIALLRDVEPYYSLKIRGLHMNKVIQVAAKLLSRFYYLADSIVVVHSNQLNAITKSGLNFKNIDVIPHPVAIDEFDCPTNVAGINIKSMNGHLLGLYVGTFGKCHSLPKLIESLLSDRITQLPINFIFVGYGEDSVDCKNLVNASYNHNVKIFKAVPFKNIPAMLQQADFLIYSIMANVYLEGVGAKFYEYLASSKPILVCGQCAAMEIVNKIGNGWCVDSSDAEKLHACLTRILVEKTKLIEMGMRGRTYLIEEEKNKTFKIKWTNLCSSLIENYG